jgi:glucose-1-phosphate adenylyltransferase
MDGVTIKGSLVADGSILREGVLIENSIIGVRSIIGRDVVIRNSIIMGNDFYEAPGGGEGRPALGIGDGARIEGAIIDKNCHIGRGARIANSRGLESSEEDQYGMIRDGVVCIPKEATIPDGWSW